MDRENSSEAIAAFRRYTEAFQTLEPQRMAAHFNEPAIMISPQGVIGLPNAAAVEQAYGRVMAELPARGYARTEFSPLTERKLGRDLVMVSGNCAWKDGAGEEIQPFGITYTLQRADGTWRIVVAAIHEPT
jgi:hypothetical protein